MKNFALIGAAGYVAPRHMKAIKDTGNKLVAVLDKNDSIGIIDSYFPQADFFTEFERFDRHIDLLKRKGTKIDYVSIASPNYLHDSHIRFALRNNAHAICEKPLVLNPHNVEALKIVQEETGCKVFNILQLRHHPALIQFREKILKELTDNNSKNYEVDLTYITSRGNWYLNSWKGNESKSGGIATNIGIHFFDMLGWIFGEVKKNVVHLKTQDTNAGYIEFSNARVRWFLSINSDNLPENVKATGQRTFRSLTVDNEEIEFSTGFTDLHTASYQSIIDGNGFGLDDAKQSIEIASQIRNLEIANKGSSKHSYLRDIKT
ncbi:MAG: oxidoreductase [Gammaproteobacteria bacterium]|nr:MAG: oxidoreductase [Gammaproteobacteria bacterium]